jgi:hypothetical protein
LDAAAPEGFTLPDPAAAPPPSASAIWNCIIGWSPLPDPAAAPPPLTPADLITLEQEYAAAPPNNDVRRLLAEVRRLQARIAAAEPPPD